MLLREKQLARKIQSVAGTPETMVDADFGGVLKNIEWSLASEMYQRDPQRGTLTKLSSLRSQHSAKCSWTEEVVGGTIGTPAPWHSALRACGMQVNTARVFTIGTTSKTGTFKTGDLIGNNATQASATKLAIVLHDEAAAFIIHQISGVADAANLDVWTNYSRTGSLTQSGTPTVCGYVFRPQSERDGSVPPMLSIEGRMGGEVYKFSEARGTFTLSMRLGEPAMFNFDFTGIPKTSNDTGTILTGTRATPPSVGAKPIRCQGIPLELINQTAVHVPVMTALELQMNNEVTLRQTVTNVDVHQSGYQQARITNRDPSFTLDPLYIKAADGFDWQGANRRGDSFQFSAKAGSLSHTNGLFIALSRSCEVEFDGGSGDRNGEVSVNPTMKLRGDDDDELYFAHVFSIS